MSDANQSAIGFAAETSLGLTATPVALQSLRFTGESLKNTKETVSSAEIRDDRQVPDHVMVGAMPQGGFDFELSFLALLPFFAAVLHNDWTVIAITETVSCALSTQVITGTAGDFTAVPPGAMLKIEGFANAANNGFRRVQSVASDGSYIVLPAGSIIANEAAVEVTFSGKTTANGVKRKSFTFEKRIKNTSGEDFFHVYRGMVPDTMELRIASKGIITGSVQAIGTTYEVGNVSIDASATATTQATGTLTFAANPTANDTCTIGGKVYTYKASVVAANQVKIGLTASASLDNLIAAITGGNGEGDLYGFDTVPHTEVTAAAGAGDTMVVTAIAVGTNGNGIATTETFTNAGNIFAAASLSGGVDPVSGYAAAADGPIMNGTSNVGTLLLDGASATERFKTLTLNIANSARGKDCIGTLGNFDIGLGTIAVTGKLSAYFVNNSLPARIQAHTSFSLDFSVQDADGNRYFFYLPVVKPSGDPTISGINSDVMIEVDFAAILDQGAGNSTGKTLIIDAFAA